MVGGRRLLAFYLPLVFALFPFYWVPATSLTANDDLYVGGEGNPFSLAHPVLDHYRRLLQETDVVPWLGNSLVGVVSCAISLACAVPAAYALARVRFAAPTALWR